MVLLRHPPVSSLGSPRLHPQQHTEKTNHFSLSSFCSHNHLFIFYFNAFLLNHVYKYPYRRLNSRLRSARSLLFFFFTSITNQPILMMIKPMSSLLPPVKQTFFSIFLEMHCCNTLLWENARLYIIYHALFTHQKIS